MAHSIEEAFAAVGLGSGSGKGRPAPAQPQPAPPRADRPCWLNTRTVGITRHAVDRFRERFMPDLDHARAHRRLCELLYETGSVTFIRDTRPDPQHPRENRNRGYLIVDDDIVLPLKESRHWPNNFRWSKIDGCRGPRSGAALGRNRWIEAGPERNHKRALTLSPVGGWLVVRRSPRSRSGEPA